MAGEIIGRLQDILLPVATDGRVLEANPAALFTSLMRRNVSQTSTPIFVRQPNVEACTASTSST